MRNYQHLDSRQASRGAVLILAMVFLVLMTLVAVTVTKTSMQEFQMAGNAQFREDAFQQAQAITSELSTDLDNFPITGTVGYTICTAADTDPACNGVNVLTTLTSDAVPTGVTVNYQVERQGPLFIEGLPFRQSQANASSAPAFDTAIFEVAADINGQQARLGSASVVQGVAIRVASSSQ
jgi:Tfp pilus assembly protein PilX